MENSSSSRLSEIFARRWHSLAGRGSSSGRRRRSRLSKGHFVVYANGGKRFVMPLKYLDHPIFQVLLEMAEEEFGSAGDGPLRVPCEDELMEHFVFLLECHPCKAPAVASSFAASMFLGAQF